jgi:hypothetical protein
MRPRCPYAQHAEAELRAHVGRAHAAVLLGEGATADLFRRGSVQVVLMFFTSLPPLALDIHITFVSLVCT